MILEIDVGNTLLKWRVVQGDQVLNRGHYPTARLAAGISVGWPEHISQIYISSVAGAAITSVLSGYCESRWQREPVFAVTQARTAGVVNSYVDPSRMGVDRWLAMLAAYNDCGKACCIVDCGSAITVDYVADSGQHEGGFIIPGLRLMSESLQSNTAEVLVDRSVERFGLEPGTHTSSAVAHGVNFAFKALQEKIVAELGSAGTARVLYITGGDGRLFHKLAGIGHYRADLVMEGLRWSVY